MNRNIIHKLEVNRFELDLSNNLIALITYDRKGDHLDLNHSEVPHTLRGQGIGKELVIKTFEEIERLGLTATAHCSYIKAVKNRDPYWSKVID